MYVFDPLLEICSLRTRTINLLIFEKVDFQVCDFTFIYANSIWEKVYVCKTLKSFYIVVCNHKSFYMDIVPLKKITVLERYLWWVECLLKFSWGGGARLECVRESSCLKHVIGPYISKTSILTFFFAILKGEAPLKGDGQNRKTILFSGRGGQSLLLGITWKYLQQLNLIGQSLLKTFKVSAFQNKFEI